MRLRCGVLVAAALLVPAVAASAQEGITVTCTNEGIRAVSPLPVPFATVQVGGLTGILTPCITQKGKELFLNAHFSSALGSGDVHAEMNPDPFITFGATTTNAIAGTVSYAFLFGTPVVPASYNTAKSSGGVTVAPGAANNTHVTTSPIYPKYISGYGTLGLAATNLGVDNGTAPCNATTVNNTCNFALVTNTFPPTPYDNLEALLTYNQDDMQSVASWSGRVDLLVTAVPEPTTVALTVSGLLALAGVARTRRRAR